MTQVTAGKMEKGELVWYCDCVTQVTAGKMEKVELVWYCDCVTGDCRQDGEGRACVVL